MIRAVFRPLCFLALIAFIAAASTTPAFSQQSAPPQVEAVIQAFQRGDQQALKSLLAPGLYSAVLAQGRRNARYASLDALGPIEKVTARRVGIDRRRVTTYDVNVVHKNGTSHWTVRIAADGRRVIAADFTTNTATVARAPELRPAPNGELKKSARRPMKNGHAPAPAVAIEVVPNATSAAPSGGNVQPAPPATGRVATPMAAPVAPPPPGPAPSPGAAIVFSAPAPSQVGAPPPPPPTAGRSHVRDRSAVRRLPSGAARIDGAPERRVAPAIVDPSATPGGSTPAPVVRSGTPVFPGAVSAAPPPPPGVSAAPASRDVPAAPVTAPEFPTLGRPTISPQDRVVDFLYATTRARDTAVETVAFSGQRSRALTYGQASVRIPEDHKIGEITVPSVWKVWGITLSEEKLDEHEHFTIRALKTLTLDEWNESIKARNPKTALIFVHGYNTSFEDALYRNAQIVWDLRYDGLSVLYSWASWGGTLEYLYDRESAQIGRAGFIEVLRNLKEKHGIESVNVIAHSMGNQVVLDALGSYARTSNPATIGELILAAPDIDRDMFISLIPDVQKIVKGITLYASSADKALQASRQLAGVLRAGDIGDDGPIVLDNVQTIDVTAMGEEILGLNHNVFAASRNLIDDIRLLLTKGLRPPDQRLSQIRPFPETAPRYWRFAQ